LSAGEALVERARTVSAFIVQPVLLRVLMAVSPALASRPLRRHPAVG
jgi:hypothetical protein